MRYASVKSRYLDFNPYVLRDDTSGQTTANTSLQAIASPRELKNGFGSTSKRIQNRQASIKNITRDKIELDHTYSQTHLFKRLCLSTNKPIVFQEQTLNDTFAYFRHVTQTQRVTFFEHRFNAKLKMRVFSEPIAPSKDLATSGMLPSLTTTNPFRTAVQSNNSNSVHFYSNFEASNLSLVASVSPNEYDLFIRVDTQSKGHQNWFNFRVMSSVKKTVKFNILNIKRSFNLYREGLKPFVAIVDQSGNTSDWEQQGSAIVFAQRLIQAETEDSPELKAHCLTFKLDLKAGVKYQVSMLPSYTYSDLLGFLNRIQADPLNSQLVGIQPLTETLTGLTLPLVTITNKNSKISEDDKMMVLFSGRIHPGETVASFIVQGVMQGLLAHPPLLDYVVFKVVPMLNPDGVTYGNFRTSFLGVDLNRSFHKVDQVLYPEVVAIKRLGQQLKEKYKDRFLCYFDVHGHSTQRNIFTYGPDIANLVSQSAAHTCKQIPKLISQHCKYFKYNMCTFKLEESKTNTARGYFLKSVKVLAYTLESSYGLYQLQNEIKKFTVHDWLQSGRLLVGALKELMEESVSKYPKLLSLSHKSNADLSNLKLTKRGDNQRGNVRVIKSTKNNNSMSQSEPKSATLQNHKLEVLNIDLSLKNIAESTKDSTTNLGLETISNQGSKKNLRKISIKEQESDLDDSSEDLSDAQRTKFQKKIYLSMLQNHAIPPKVVEKQSIIYPMITPTLYKEQQFRADDISVRLIQHRKGLGSVINNQKREKIIKELQSLAMIQPHQRNMIHFT